VQYRATSGQAEAEQHGAVERAHDQRCGDADGGRCRGRRMPADGERPDQLGAAALLLGPGVPDDEERHEE
jgi:hypothetical protein